MMLRLVVGIFFASLFFANGLAAQSVEEVEVLMKQISDKHKSMSAMAGDFELLIEIPEEDLDEQQKGSFALEGQKFKLQLAGQQVWCDGNFIWTYLEEAEEVQKNFYEEDEEFIRIDQLFSMYNDNFIFRFREDIIVDNVSAKLIELSPKDKELPFFKIELMVDASRLQVLSAKIFEKSGLRMTYRIKNFKENPSFDSSFFTFDPLKFSGVELVDLTE